ncbi:hypothetical protein GCM10011571_02380 [Marinithermofilum abyssi]|uniref:Uncharacterized protein n=1 Tax=Marinithermofilum abyssi TaxID=1571185 RepID=A0A8J2YBL0_9BACL|nr:hypothetical protein [Marinithermofilum abyssi]GGE04877.1 hypothetical protein GCM10011571_02380 [Marinithermofilum abyssi]
MSPGEVFACLQSSGIKKEARQKYTFNATFQPQADDYENNDYRWNAYKTELFPGFHLDKERKIRIDAQKEASLRSVFFLLYDRHLRVLDQARLSGNQTAGTLSIRLKPGTYVLRVQGLPAAAAGTYRLLLQ